jgi:hypothetical protein
MIQSEIRDWHPLNRQTSYQWQTSESSSQSSNNRKLSDIDPQKASAITGMSLEKLGQSVRYPS